MFYTCCAQIVELLACKCGLCRGRDARFSFAAPAWNRASIQEDEKHGPPAFHKVRALLYTGIWGLEWERAPPILLAAPAWS